MQVRPIHMYKVPTEYPDRVWYSYIHAHAKYNERLTNSGPATTVQPDIIVIQYRVYSLACCSSALQRVVYQMSSLANSKKKHKKNNNKKKRFSVTGRNK